MKKLENITTIEEIINFAKDNGVKLNQKMTINKGDGRWSITEYMSMSKFKKEINWGYWNLTKIKNILVVDDWLEERKDLVINF